MAYTTVKETFEKMPTVFDAFKAQGLNAVIQYKFDGPEGGSWMIELMDGKCRISEGTHESPNVAIEMTVKTWLALVNNEMSGMQAFMGGKLKATGDTMLAQKVPALFPL